MRQGGLRAADLHPANLVEDLVIAQAQRTGLLSAAGGVRGAKDLAHGVTLQSWLFRVDGLLGENPVLNWIF